MARSGRLIMVKVVLTAILIYLLIALDVPKWFIRAVDKYRRAFLWRGRQDLKGGHYPVAWPRVTRPLELGGLGDNDLQTMAWALQLRWLWLEKTNPGRPWKLLKVQVPNAVRVMFAISVTSNVGDGSSTIFWTDRWIHGKSLQDLAPALMSFVLRRGWRMRTVCDALHDNSWTSDIVGGLSVLAAWQLLQVHDVLAQMVLDPQQRDQHCWLPDPSGQFTTKSAYRRFNEGSVRFEPYKRLWKAWAPLKAKMFIWLAYWKRCWTLDHLQWRGLPHPSACPLCDQCDENINHILVECVFSREVWFQALQAVGLQRLALPVNAPAFQTWWRQAARRAGGDAGKGLNSLIILVAWELWKLRNRCVFEQAQPRVHELLRVIKDEVNLWAAAGAKKLRQLLRQGSGTL